MSGWSERECGREGKVRKQCVTITNEKNEIELAVPVLQCTYNSMATILK